VLLLGAVGRGPGKEAAHMGRSSRRNSWVRLAGGAGVRRYAESWLLYKLEAIRFSSSSRGKPSYVVTGREKEEEKERKC
jgi:hypothetical protein